MTIKMIAAVSKNGVIGRRSTNSIPWNYPEDFKFFKDMTSNNKMSNATSSTIIMGRKTFESIGSKPLPKRRNIVITRSKIEGIECLPTVEAAICDDMYNSPPENWEGDLFTKQSPSIWLIGGESIYREGLKYADEIFLTLIPEEVDGDVYFPWIDPLTFRAHNFIPLDAERKQLAVVTHYVRNKCRICALGGVSEECHFEKHK